MKRVAKWVGAVFAVLLLLAGGAVGWVQLTWSVDHPDTPYPEVRASDDPAVIAQGEYVVHAVAHCSTCHGPAELLARRQIEFDQPLTGGNVWNMGPFGTFTAANLTPHASGISSMSDGEVARTIRYGIGRHGKLSPMMRFGVGPMSDEDLTAVISWLRAQEPVAGEWVPPKFGLLAKALSGRFKPRLDAPPEHVPAGAVSLDRGRYLAEGPAMCSGCHTPLDPMAGFAPSGPAFSGAGEADPDPTMPGYEIIAPNLTPDSRTGHIAAWTEDHFVARFQSGRVIGGSVMPWESYQRLTEEDVRSIYRYLRSLPPTERQVGPTHRQAGSFKP